MTRRTRIGTRSGVAAITAAALTLTGLAAAPATGAVNPIENVQNGSFSSGKAPWWSTGNTPTEVVAGELCAQVPAGTANPWDAIVGQNDVHLDNGAEYTLSFKAYASQAVSISANVGINAAPYPTVSGGSAALTTTKQTFTRTFTADRTSDIAQVAFQVGGKATAFTFCVDDVSLLGGAPEQLANGTFTDGTNPWWTSNVTVSVVNGEMCANVPATANPWEAIVGVDQINLVENTNYRLSFLAHSTATKGITANLRMPNDAPIKDTAFTVTSTPQTFSADIVTSAGQTTDKGKFMFFLGGAAAPFTICFDNVSLAGGAGAAPYAPETGPRVRVNQVGYLPFGPKAATIVTDKTAAFAWALKNSAGTTVATGMTTPRGVDPSSGLNVQTADFSGYTTAGTGFTVVADGETSHPFDISAAAYEKLRKDAPSYFYPARSGIEILGSVAGAEYARPAGHIGIAPNKGDTAVPCQTTTQSMVSYGVPWTCDYTLDVTGGWYDAGDHGKYVVNGGISVAQLMSTYERTLTKAAADTVDRRALGDGSVRVPEQGNKVPDLLDESRWELEWMLKMQVPAGKPLAGMVHHKIHDDAWTGLPMMPHLDPQPRSLHRPSTAATLNVAAVAAQGARLFAPYDKAFSARLLAAARTAYAAAKATPALYASSNASNGGGPYNDNNVSDEFYWAAAELFITTGETAFRQDVLSSSRHAAPFGTDGAMDWGNTAALGALDLAVVKNNLPGRNRLQALVLASADGFLADQQGEAFGQVYSPESGRYDWGSNSFMLNNMIVLATAFDISGDAKYRNGVLTGMDYLFGRNALNQSYITGYGEQNSHNQHSRWYANQKDASFPNPPVGSISGGPNSSIQDPVAQKLLTGCLPQFCYVDDIESWSTNEITVNWNAPLSWIASWIADQDNGLDGSHNNGWAYGRK